MKDIFVTRFMHIKKHVLSFGFWLLFPLLATLVVVYGFGQVTEDADIPVGVAVEQSSPEAEMLVQDMADTNFIRLVKTDQLSGKKQLKKHELDSVFVIPEDYAEHVKHGKRHRLLESYQSDQSFAYVPIKEMVISYVQEAFDRSRTVKVLDQLAAEYGEKGKWTRDDIIQTSKKIQDEQDLLHVSLSMDGSTSDDEDSGSMLHIWALWASFNLLATLLLFDWVIHERHAGVRPRFAFMRVSFTHYLLLNALLYVLGSAVLDVVALMVFEKLWQVTIPLGVLLSFQVFLSLGAFLLAQLFKRSFIYYMVAFAITLVIAIGSGTILPNQGLIHEFPWLMQLNPLQPFLDGEYGNGYTLIVVAVVLIWYVKRGMSRVTS